MGLARQIARTHVHANADADAAAADASLREWCLYAAVGIRAECASSVPISRHSEFNHCAGRQAAAKNEQGKDENQGKSSHNGAGDGVVTAPDEDFGQHIGGRCEDAANDRGIKPGDTLVGCGEPLVQLLSRQASRLIGLYENSGENEQQQQKSTPSSSWLIPHSETVGACESICSSRLTSQDRGLKIQIQIQKGCDNDGDNDTARSPQLNVTSNLGHGSKGQDRNPPAVAVCNSRSQTNPHQLVLKRLDDLLSIAYARFYAYLYRDLPLCWRQLYTDASILKFSLIYELSRRPQSQGGNRPARQHDASDVAFSVSDRSPVDTKDDSLDEMIKTLDLALILAGAGGQARGRKWINKAFELLECVQVQQAATTTIPAEGRSSSPGRSASAIAENAAAAARYDHEKTDSDISAPGDAETPHPLSPSRPTKRAKLDIDNNNIPGIHDGDTDSTTAAIGPALSRYQQPPWAATSQSPSFSARRPFTPPVRYAIRRFAATDMNMPAFQRYMDAAPRGGPQPLILTGLVDDWPARRDRPWNKPAYLLSRTLGGRRLVPVEVGRSYVDEGWGQKIVRFGGFLRDYIDTSLDGSSLSTSPPASQNATPTTHFQSEEKPSKIATNSAHNSQEEGPAQKSNHKPPTTNTIAYLAQHQLFLQLPHLRNDILIPDHCYTAPPPHPDPNDPSRELTELEEPLLNAWFGPPGTITPLHTDPYHNLLVQVVGSKYVRLYAPHAGSDSQYMRRRGKEGGVDMGNTSLWDVGVVEGWDDDSLGLLDNEDGSEADLDEKMQREEERAKEAEDFKKVPFVDCILEPGDALYIPVGWWHYVRGLSVSFSVSIWWN